MSEQTIEASCGFCAEQFKTVVTVPDGWRFRFDAIDIEGDLYCPKHAGVVEWMKDQCPGCVGSWGSCGMYDSFAYSTPRKPITDDDLRHIETGVCSRRTNGTFALTRDDPRIRDIDLSTPSSAGTAMAGAIRDYIAEYGLKHLETSGD